MSLGSDLLKFLVADAGVNAVVKNRVHQNHVPDVDAMPAANLESDGSRLPYIWFMRFAEESARTTDESPGTPAFSTSFDLEIVSDDIDEALDLAAAVRTLLDGFRGSFGDSTVQAVFIEDKDDNYIPRNEKTDEGFHIASMEVQIIPR